MLCASPSECFIVDILQLIVIQLLLDDYLCDNVHIYVNYNFLHCMHVFY